MCESFVTPEFWNWSKASEYSVGRPEQRSAQLLTGRRGDAVPKWLGLVIGAAQKG